MKYVDEFRDPELGRVLAGEILGVVEPGRHYKVMEVCGGHTHSIYKYGVDDLLPTNVELVHGPGCPVCVIPMGRVDDGIAIARQPGVIFTCFGDMMRVPGSEGSLLEAKAAGAGYAHHVAEAGEDHARLVGHGDAVVDAAHRDHAHRAARPVHELDVGRQQVVDAVLVDRVRVAAADLHHLVVTARLDGPEDLPGQRPAELRIAELVHVLHRHAATPLSARAMAVPA